MTIAKSRVIFCTFIMLVAGVAGAQADSLSSIMGWPYDANAGPGFNYPHAPAYGSNAIPARITAIEYPVLGLPEIVAPNEELTVIVYYPHGHEYPNEADWQVRLTTAYANPADNFVRIGDPVAQNYDVVVQEAVYDATFNAYHLKCVAPEGVPEDVYGIAVTVATIADFQPAAVAIRKHIGGTFTFAHLCDIQLNDLASYSVGNELTSGDYPGAGFGQRSVVLFTNEIQRELALLRPDFAVVGGDLSYGDDYEQNISTLAAILAATKTPLFLAPGNHDGYAYYGRTTVATDGLEYYARAWGPLYYSFDYGPVHFAVANSYDGSTARRQGIDLGIFGSPVENWGGFMGDAQYAWLTADLTTVADAGKRTMLFMHHDPRGPYKADAPYPTDPFNKTEQLWNFDSSAWDSDPADSIKNETKQHNTGTKLLTTALQNDVSHVFIGHSHWDAVWQYKKGDPILDRDNQVVDVPVAPQPFAVVQTTTASAGVEAGTGKREYNGYRLVDVVDGGVTSLNKLNASQPDRSVPAGNLWFTPTNNNGTSTYAQIEVVNGLPAELPVTLQFFMARQPQGYEIVNEDTGTPVRISDLGLGENGEAVLYAKTTVHGVNPKDFPVAAGQQERVHFAARLSGDNSPPTASFTVTPSTTAKTYHFDASASTSGKGGVLRYFWDFGDGFTGVGETVDHGYPRGGQLVVTLTVMDRSGGSAITQTALGVSECCPDRHHKTDHFACGECATTGSGSPWSGLASLLAAALGVFLMRFILGERRGK